MNEIEKAVQKSLLGKIDVEGIAKRLVPKVEKSLELAFIKSLDEWVCDSDLIEELSQEIPTQAIARHIAKIIRERFL